MLDHNYVLVWIFLVLQYRIFQKQSLNCFLGFSFVKSPRRRNSGNNCTHLMKRLTAACPHETAVVLSVSWTLTPYSKHSIPRFFAGKPHSLLFLRNNPVKRNWRTILRLIFIRWRFLLFSYWALCICTPLFLSQRSRNDTIKNSLLFEKFENGFFVLKKNIELNLKKYEGRQI